jgi:hypothetical protein
MTEKEKLIQAWARGLEDNAEQQLHAMASLHEAIDGNATTLPDVHRLLESADARSRARRRRMLWSLLILALLAMAWPTYQAIRTSQVVRQISNAMAIHFFGSPPSEPPRVVTASAEESFLLYGDLTRPRESDQQRALWDREKNNPVFFANYAKHCVSEGKDVPPDFLKEAAAIDPDNAWFPEFAASVRSEKAAKKERTVHPASPVKIGNVSRESFEDPRRMERKVVYQYSVADRAAFDETMRLWRQSLQQKGFDDYGTALHQMRYPVLSRRHDLVRDMPALAYMSMQPPWQIRMRRLCDTLVAALQEADLKTDEGKQLFRDVHAYSERIAARKPGNLIDILVARAVLVMIYKQIDVIDTSALDPAMVQSWQQRNQQLAALNDQIQSASHDSDAYRQHSSLLMAMSLPAIRRQVLHPPPVSLELLKPTRYAEHCFFAKFALAGFCLVLLILVPMHVWGARQRLIHRIVDVAWLSLPLRSVMALIGLGVVVPIVYYTCLVIFTPLTGKEFGPAEGLIFPFYPLITLALILLVLPRLLVHRSVTDWQQLCPRPQRGYLRFGWIALGLLMVPLHGMPFLVSSVKDFTIFATLLIILAAPAVCWLLWTSVRAFIGRSFYKSLMQGMCRRMVGVCSLSAIVLLSLAHVGLSRAEHHWTKQDVMFAVSPEIPTLQFEAEITRIAHTDLLKAMGL